MAETMRDHQYPMRDALASALEPFIETWDDANKLAECGDCGAFCDVDNNGQCEECWREENEETQATMLLSIDERIVTDYMIAVGGPTRFFRTWASHGEVYRVEYHDSWAHPTDHVVLSDNEAVAVLDALGVYA